jgi:hypothetical protein
VVPCSCVPAAASKVLEAMCIKLPLEAAKLILEVSWHVITRGRKEKTADEGMLQALSDHNMDLKLDGTQLQG